MVSKVLFISKKATPDSLFTRNSLVNLSTWRPNCSAVVYLGLKQNWSSRRARFRVFYWGLVRRICSNSLPVMSSRLTGWLDEGSGKFFWVSGCGSRRRSSKVVGITAFEELLWTPWQGGIRHRLNDASGPHMVCRLGLISWRLKTPDGILNLR
jgi:hypothetical protein